MTEQEKQQIVEEIEERLLSKMKGTVIKEDIGDILKGPRHKWFRSSDAYGESLMYKVFGTYIYYAVWDCVRKLTCYICGTSYVRKIKDCEYANEVADALCQVVYDYAIKYREKEKVLRSTDQSNA